MSAEKPFTYPELIEGQTVQISFDNNFSKPTMGWVVQRKNNSCSVFMYSRPNGQNAVPVFVPDCRHRDDPRIKDNPTWLLEEPRGRGLFVPVLSPNESMLLARIAGLEKEMADIRKESAGLRELFSQLTSAEPTRKRQSREPVEV
jgi:hypothetical protein